MEELTVFVEVGKRWPIDRLSGVEKRLTSGLERLATQRSVQLLPVGARKEGEYAIVILDGDGVVCQEVMSQQAVNHVLYEIEVCESGQEHRAVLTRLVASMIRVQA